MKKLVLLDSEISLVIGGGDPVAYFSRQAYFSDYIFKCTNRGTIYLSAPSLRPKIC